MFCVVEALTVGLHFWGSCGIQSGHPVMDGGDGWVGVSVLVVLAKCIMVKVWLSCLGCGDGME